MTIAAVFVWLVCGGFTAYIASQRGANGRLWLVLGLLFGPFALIAAFAAKPTAKDGDVHKTEISSQRAPAVGDDPRLLALIANLRDGRPVAESVPPAPREASPALKKCPDCAEEVRAEARKCRFCGYRFEPKAQERVNDTG
jgi:hypothetical protein